MSASRRQLRFRQCDVERAIRAARAAGGGVVVVRQDGDIVIDARSGVELPPSEKTEEQGAAKDEAFPLW